MLNINFIKHHCLLMALGILVLPGTSVALLQKTIPNKPIGFQSDGVRLGSFTLKSGAELMVVHNDNIFSIQTGEISDSIMHALPWVSLNSDWNRHALNLNFNADIANYRDFGNEDYEDWMVGFDGRIDVKRSSNFNYQASYMDTHEPRSSTDDVGGIKPTDFTVNTFNVGYSHTFNRLTAILNYDRGDTDYDNNLDGDGNVLLNQDRDRTRDEAILRLDYELSGDRSIFFSTTKNYVDYDQKVDDSGLERSSDGYGFKGGVSWDLTGVLVGDLFLEYIKQEFDDPELLDIDGFGIGASLDWTPTELTSINLLFSNTPQETTQRLSSGYLSSVYSIRLQHELRRNWLVNANLSFTDNDYEFSGDSPDALTNTEVTQAGVNLSYLFNRHVYISGGYVYSQQRANTPSFEFTSNRWFITLGFDL